MSNSLTELNQYSRRQVLFQDDRAYVVEVTGTATNQTVSVTEDQSHTVPKSWTFGQLQSVPGNVIMTIDGSTVGNTFYTSWIDTDLPQGVTLTNTAPGVYQLTGLNGKGVFDTLSTPRIVAKDRTTNFSYTAQVQYPTPGNNIVLSSIDWNVAVTVTAAHAELSTPANVNWEEDQTKIEITGAPQITDEFTEPGDYTMVITPSDVAAVFRLTSTGALPGTFDPATGSLTLVGSKSNVNSSLSNLVLTPTSDYDQSFTLNYQLTNPISGLQTAVTQTFTITATDTDFTIDNFEVYNGIFSPMNISIGDQDPNADEYTIIISEINNDPEPVWGEFRVGTVIEEPPQPTGGLTPNPDYILDRTPGTVTAGVIEGNRNSITLTIDRVTFNNQVIEYRSTSKSNVSFEYTQIKNDPIQGAIVQADAVPFTGFATETLVTQNVIKNMREDGAVLVEYTVFEPYDSEDTESYTLKMTQISPEPVSADTKGTFSVDSVELLTNISPTAASGTTVDFTLYSNVFYPTPPTPNSSSAQPPKRLMLFMGSDLKGDFKYIQSYSPGIRIAYNPPADFRGTAQFQIELSRQSATLGTVDLTPVNNTYTVNITEFDNPLAGYTLNTTFGTALSGGGNIVAGEYNTPGDLGYRPISFNISDLDRVTRVYGLDPGRLIKWEVRQTSPDPTIPGPRGFFCRTSAANPQGDNLNKKLPGVPITGVSAGVTTISMCLAGLLCGFDEAIEGAVPPIWPTVGANVFANEIVYYAPPGYIGEVELALDIYKTRHGEDIYLADSIPIDILVPQQNLGPAANNFEPVFSMTALKNITSGGTYDFRDDIKMLDPAGGRTPSQSEYLYSRYNFRLTQDVVKGTFRFRNISTNTINGIGESVNFVNQTQQQLQRWLELAFGTNQILEFAAWTGAFAIGFEGYTPAPLGPLTLSLEVDRIYDGITTNIATRQLTYNIV